MHSLYNHARPHSLDLLRYYNIPVYDALETACKCMAALAEYGNYLHRYHAKAKFVFNKGAKSKSRGSEIFKKAREENREALFEYEAKELISLHGVPILRAHLAQSGEEAVGAKENFGCPVAMKIVSPDILHKTDAGGVRLDLNTADEILEAYNGIIESAGKYNS